LTSAYASLTLKADIESGYYVEVVVGEFSPWHWLLVALIALLLFGPKKLPELGKGLAEGIRGFKEGMKEQPPAQASSEQNKNSETKS